MGNLVRKINVLCFNNPSIRPIQHLAAKILALTTFWCKGDSNYFKRTLVLPNDFKGIGVWHKRWHLKVCVEQDPLETNI